MQPESGQPEPPADPSRPTEVSEDELDRAAGGEISFNFSKPAVEYKEQ